ncbi:MAG: F0F1 ATP synthase subunit epsilon [Actinobacteria bacterium]|nr:F0F1 ATP synthase subunit epsilon [Actinomycetota bacterium]
MSKPFSLTVVSPESIVWSGSAELLVTRTTEGEIGILADHEPTMAALATGSTVITAEGGEQVSLAIHGGFLQVLHNEVTLLTDRAEIAEGGREEAARLAGGLADGA